MLLKRSNNKLVIEMNMAVPEEVIERIRNDNDIVEVVEDYVQLKKQGRNYFGLCPFHDEKSPSFSVTADKQIFHCFGCKKGGNVISFMMEIESLSFIEAIRYLADRSNIELPETANQPVNISKEAADILSAYEWLTKYYHHLVKYSDEGKQALEYLTERQVTKQSVDDFQLGYAPLNSDVTLDFMKNKGFHSQLLVKAGLITTKDNQTFADVYRGRVIFPIINHLGKTVAFSGRALTDNGPKYFNSPEHELFQKSNLLFNFHLAKNHIRKENEAILFEGAMDVIQAFQSGVKHSVATLGTALSMYQAKLLKRYTDKVIICYDADDAGIEASFKAIHTLRQAGCEVGIVNLPDKNDPDQFIKENGADEFRELIKGSDTYFRFYMRYKRRKYNIQADGERIAYIEDLTNELANVRSTIERDYYVKEIADEFNLSTEILYSDIEKHIKRNNHYTRDNKQQNSNNIKKHYNISKKETMKAFQNAERMLLTYMFQYPDILEKVQQTIGTHFNIEEHQVILTHLYALYEENDDINISKLVDKLEDHYLQELVTELAMLPVNEAYTEQEINDYIRLIQREKHDFSKLRLLRQKQKTEQNPILAAQIGLEIIQLEKQLKQS